MDQCRLLHGAGIALLLRPPCFLGSTDSGTCCSAHRTALRASSFCCTANTNSTLQSSNCLIHAGTVAAEFIKDTIKVHLLVLSIWAIIAQCSGPLPDHL